MANIAEMKFLISIIYFALSVIKRLFTIINLQKIGWEKNIK